MSEGSKKGERARMASSVLGRTLASTAIGPLVGPAALSLAPSTPTTWDAAVAEYRRNPSDRAFNSMQATYANSKAPKLAEVVVLAMAIGKNTSMFFRHLAAAFYVDRRLLEAEHFASRWLAVEPDNLDAHNLKARICVDRGELRSAIEHYNVIERVRPDSIEVVRLRLMIHLRLDQLGNAQADARALVRFPNLIPMDVHLVAETGVRACDPDLVSDAVLRRDSPYNKRGEHSLREVARVGLVRTLVAKAATP